MRSGDKKREALRAAAKAEASPSTRARSRPKNATGKRDARPAEVSAANQSLILKAARLKIELWSLFDVTPYDRNPRLNDGAVEAVAASLQQFGFRKPIVVDAQGVIVCGHTCYRAAKQLGLAKVPVHVASDLSPEQVRAYRIADNKTGELAEWDFGLLSIELAELRAEDFDLSQLGFAADELADLLDGSLVQGLTDPDEVPAPPDHATTQRGDIWLLGDHRLMCGDSSVAADLDRVLEGASIHLVNSDPPYNVRLMYLVAA